MAQNGFNLVDLDRPIKPCSITGSTKVKPVKKRVSTCINQSNTRHVRSDHGVKLSEWCMRPRSNPSVGPSDCYKIATKAELDRAILKACQDVLV